MGIDKADIQSVIHYDLPKSIENYVQEIGRAGRDGKLARCHLFLSDSDFYELRSKTLADLLDTQSGLQLTNSLICQAKRDLAQIVMPELVAPKRAGKKRKLADVEAEDAAVESLIEEFEHEEQLEPFYSSEGGQKKIRLDEIPELENKPFYVTMDTKEVTAKLDLKKEVVLTMLNQLEQVEDSFFRVDSILPAFV